MASEKKAIGDATLRTAKHWARYLVLGVPLSRAPSKDPREGVSTSTEADMLVQLPCDVKVWGTLSVSSKFCSPPFEPRYHDKCRWRWTTTRSCGKQISRGYRQTRSKSPDSSTPRSRSLSPGTALQRRSFAQDMRCGTGYEVRDWAHSINPPGTSLMLYHTKKLEPRVVIVVLSVKTTPAQACDC
ncbi:hypothetical protein GE09DRAFT_391053 [Coniochaeta sp. 2T2.1]|nr:hypothetical protein GE09DRAFT_391053 [Coniochaeta sp. 2T2.1]